MIEVLTEFDGRSAELRQAAERCRQQLARANSDPALSLDERQALIAALLASVGPDGWIETPFTCEFGVHLRVGARTFVNRNCQFHDTTAITIGDDVLVGPGVQIITATHPLHPDERIPAGGNGFGTPYRTQVAPVHIGNRVWIGAGSIILGGVTIGDGTTIGAGSIVTRDIPGMVVAVGQPARVLRTLEPTP